MRQVESPFRRESAPLVEGTAGRDEARVAQVGFCFGVGEQRVALFNFIVSGGIAVTLPAHLTLQMTLISGLLLCQCKCVVDQDWNLG